MDGALPVAEAQKRAPAEIKAVANFLRSKNGPRSRAGVLNGKRVEYFKGKSAVKALLSPAYKKVKSAPKVENEQEASQLLMKMLPNAFFLRTERPTPPTPPPSGQPRPLQMAPQQSFSPDAYYTWFMSSSPISTIIGSAALVVVILAGCMFPLWPPIMRLGVWYLSLGVFGLIGAFFGLALVRLVFWLITRLTLRKAIWIFPRLFDDCGVLESFVPWWGWDEPEPRKKHKKHHHHKSSKTTKANGSGDSTAATPANSTSPAPAAAEADAKIAAAAMEGGGAQGMRKRQQAYVEDADE